MRRVFLTLLLASCATETLPTPASPNAVGQRTFGALLSTPAEPVGTDACLFRREGLVDVFTRALAPAVRPMPEIAPDAERIFVRSETVRLLSRWGVDGEGGPYVATATHHPPPPDGLAVVVFVEGERAHVRSTRGEGPRGESLAPGDVLALLTPLASRRPVLVLAMRADAPASRLLPFAHALAPLGLPAAVGVVAAPVEDVPLTEAPVETGVGRCESLPRAPLGTRPGGMLPERARDAFAGVRAGVLACVEHGSSRRVALGGRARLAVRLGPDATVEDACFVEDELRDPAFRACVLDSLRAMPWPAPDPAGTVDLVLPLQVARDESAAAAVYCGDVPSNER